MNVTKLEISTRSDGGKGPARRLRRGGQIPAVAYGQGIETVQLSVSPKQLHELLISEHGKNSVVELPLQSGPIKALLRDYQYHPVTRELLHADFVKIDDDRMVDVEIPLEVEGKAAGVVLGGVLRLVFRYLPVRCLPKDIPVKVTHDVTELGLEEHVTAGEIALPDGVTVRLAQSRTVIAVVGEQKSDDPEETTAEAAAPAAGEAAPAEGEKPAEPEKKA